MVLCTALSKCRDTISRCEAQLQHVASQLQATILPDNPMHGDEAANIAHLAIQMALVTEYDTQEAVESVSDAADMVSDLLAKPTASRGECSVLTQSQWLALMRRVWRALHDKASAMKDAQTKVKAMHESGQQGVDATIKKVLLTTESVNFKNFEVIKPLSKGAYGEVFLVRKVVSQDVYAMKVTPMSPNLPLLFLMIVPPPKVIQKKGGVLAQKNFIDRVMVERSIMNVSSNPTDLAVSMYYSFQALTPLSRYSLFTHK